MQFERIVFANIVRRLRPATTLAAALAFTSCEHEPQWKGTPIQPARTVAQTTFSDSTGLPVQLLPPEGHAALVFFGYTNCPDVCPTTLADWTRVRSAMKADSSRVRFVFVTIDPARDTPAVAQRFAANFHPAFVGVSASQAEIDALQKTFGATATITDSKAESAHSSESHVTGHSVQTFLVDSKGSILVAYRFGAGWDVMSADINTLLSR